MPAFTDEEDIDSIPLENSDSNVLKMDSNGGEKGSASSSSDKKSESEVGEELARKETQAVFRLRVLVFLVLLCAAIAVSVVVYLISTRAEENQFEIQFVGSAERLLDSFNNIIEQKVAAVGAIALAFTAYASSHNLTWPFVTMKDFHLEAASTMSLSEALFVGCYPKVSEENRNAYEQYVMDNFYDVSIEAFRYQEQAGVNPFTANRRPVFYQSSEQLEAIHNAYINSTNFVHNSTQDGNSSTAVNRTMDISSGVYNHIYYWNQTTWTVSYDTHPAPYFPIYQYAPATATSGININLNTPGTFHYGRLERCLDEEKVILTGFDVAPPGDILAENQMTALIATWLSYATGKETYYEGDPLSNLYIPVFDSFTGKRNAVAVVNAVINWRTYFTHVLPQNIRGVHVVLKSNCVGSYTYEVNGADVRGIGYGDLHEPKFDYLEQSFSFADISRVADGTQLGLELNQEGCPYSLHIYPSQVFYDTYSTTDPIVVTCSVAITFVFMACMFLLYDRLVERRQRLVLFKANQSTALVSSLFPKNVRDRLLADNDDGGKSSSFMSAKSRVKTFLADGSSRKGIGEQPIADLFPHVTVMFADIAGFTAWASSRDPSQVFILLQSIYRAFDELAAKRKVFKVETIGDSYVAVAGLPDPQPNHAVIMARFAWDCVHKMADVVKDMERTLGPDTGDLEMRFGLHSGPVTAGVLLGDRARFQLFGDTVNTASRMEGTGIPSKVQASQVTAGLLIKAGKGHWVQPRQDIVVAKGKGVMNTFWIDPFFPSGSKRTETSANDKSDLSDSHYQVRSTTTNSQMKNARMIDWVVELFQEHIRKIVARHAITVNHDKNNGEAVNNSVAIFNKPSHQITLDEVAEVINLPVFDAQAVLKSEKMLGSIDISPEVISQLSAYVGTIASAYRDNPFHNFEHACHVTMAVDKFLRRIVAPDLGEDKYKASDGVIASHLHDYTHGINSDPLTIFAIVFSALIHDVDHRGVSNTQLIKEEEKMAGLYRNKSIAEQNSLDIAWELLMSNDFIDLRTCLFPTKADLLRFRQVVVNVVLATDIFDKELNDLRKARWMKAFSENANTAAKEFNDLRATIVIEHIIQASDVSHTMQHWHVYRKWNERLFKEMYNAYREGRMGADPSTFWYKGELGFFDNYIIPLAKKLNDCKVFGVSSDECLNYAELNRAEWEQRGEQILAEMMAQIVEEDCPFALPEQSPEEDLDA